MGERYFRKLGLCVILSATALYIFMFMGTQKLAGKIHNPFFVNTPGCRIMAMDVMNPNIAKYTFWEWNHPKFHLECLEVTWFRALVEKGNWYLKLVPDIEKILEKHGLSHESQIHCYSMEFRSLKARVLVLMNRRKFDLEYPFAIKVPKGVLQWRVQCINSLTNDTLCEDAHYFIQPPPEELLLRPPPTLRYWNKKMKNKDGAQPISVMVVGLDSVSHLNFIRQMPKTNAYIRQNTSHVEFWGFNKIESNTYPNLIPMITGLSEEEASKFWDSKRKMDDLPFIWKDYKAAGYNTTFGEDHTTYSMFYFNKPGFAKSITDHNFHDLLSQVSCKRMPSTMPDSYCIGGRTLMDVLMEMNYQMLPHLQRYPFFSFYWWASGVHEYLNTPRLMDERFERFFRSMNDAGITNNTIIVFMSDHGLRWGSFRKTFQGMTEECQPFLSVLYPAWMRKKYPLAIHNLAENAHSLVTTYDLYETFNHILHPNFLKDEHITRLSEKLSRGNGSEIPRGVSLFLPIPPERTCKTSHILSRYCLCHKQVPISADSSIAKLAANVIVNTINKLLAEYPVCIPLQLESIVSAHYAASERQNDYYIERGHGNDFYSEEGPKRHDVGFDQDIIVRLQTKPGEATYFEAMTRMHKKKLYLIGDIVRVGGDANKNNDCIQNPVLEPFCYCAI